MFKIHPVLGSDADILFAGIFNTTVTDTIQWDGPNNLTEYRAALEEKADLHAKGDAHFFTVIEVKTNTPIGSINIRPENEFRANIGLWIAEKYQGRGAGTSAVKQIAQYGFDVLGLKKIEASVFAGNMSSRKIFEKNGFILEGTIRCASKKRGQFLDEWLLGIIKAEKPTGLESHG